MLNLLLTIVIKNYAHKDSLFEQRRLLVDNRRYIIDQDLVDCLKSKSSWWVSHSDKTVPCMFPERGVLDHLNWFKINSGRYLLSWP